MRRVWLHAASEVTRLWTRAYTWRVPVAVRTRRRGEVESDLWEWVHDTGSTTRPMTAWRVLQRLVLGMADDLQWRLEQRQAPRHVPRVVGMVLLGGAMTALGVAWWPSRMPDLPSPPLQAGIAPAEVPPPPPPPPRPGEAPDPNYWRRMR